MDGEKFFGSVVALGSLGIVTQLTLDIEPTYEMTPEGPCRSSSR